MLPRKIQRGDVDAFRCERHLNPVSASIFRRHGRNPFSRPPSGQVKSSASLSPSSISSASSGRSRRNGRRTARSTPFPSRRRPYAAGPFAMDHRRHRRSTRRKSAELAEADGLASRKLHRAASCTLRARRNAVVPADLIWRSAMKLKRYELDPTVEPLECFRDHP
jgi:hypothetical protein